MKSFFWCFMFLLCTMLSAKAQNETAAKVAPNAVFERITKGMANFKVDTTAAPDDKITRKIIELRNLGGGFNINEAVAFMLEEDRQKKELRPEQVDSLSAFFTIGNGKRWLDNAANHIYRDHFTYKELKQLVKFYRTAAGKKMATDFPLVVLKSMAAAEMLKNGFEKKSN